MYLEVLFFSNTAETGIIQSIINSHESKHILALSNKIEESWHIRLKKAALLNAIIASIWTLIIVLPIEPFPILLRIIVSGGPGVWFVLGYILFIIVGFCGFSGLSYIYYTNENEGRRINGKLALMGFIMAYVGTIGATVMLAIAGTIGGYEYSIVHSSTEKIRRLLEPLVNPIRLLTIITIMGIILQVLAVTTTKNKLKPRQELSNLKNNKYNEHYDQH